MIVFIRILGVLAGGLCSAFLLRACLSEEEEKTPGKTKEEPGEKETEGLTLSGGGLDPGRDDRAVSVGENASISGPNDSGDGEHGKGSESVRRDAKPAFQADVSEDEQVKNGLGPPREEVRSEDEASDCDTGPTEGRIAETSLAPKSGSAFQIARDCQPSESIRADAEPQNGGVKRNSEILRELGRKIGSGDFTGEADLSAVLNTGNQVGGSEKVF